MFTLDDLRQTRVFQEIQQESLHRGLQQGLQQGEINLLIRQIARKFGTLPPDRVLQQIRALPIDRLEELGEALLDFVTIDDLYAWLDSNSPTP